MKQLSTVGDPLRMLARVVDFEAFRLMLVTTLTYSDVTKCGRSCYDPVVRFKVQVLAEQSNVSDARMEWRNSDGCIPRDVATQDSTAARRRYFH